MQAKFGGRYNRRAARDVLDDVEQQFGIAAVKQLIRELDLVEKLDIDNPGSNVPD